MKKFIPIALLVLVASALPAYATNHHNNYSFGFRSFSYGYAAPAIVVAPAVTSSCGSASYSAQVQQVVGPILGTTQQVAATTQATYSAPAVVTAPTVLAVNTGNYGYSNFAAFSGYHANAVRQRVIVQRVVTPVIRQRVVVQRVHSAPVVRSVVVQRQRFRPGVAALNVVTAPARIAVGGLRAVGRAIFGPRNGVNVNVNGLNIRVR